MPASYTQGRNEGEFPERQITMGRRISAGAPKGLNDFTSTFCNNNNDNLSLLHTRVPHRRDRS